jgi:hypothetical protein
MLDPLPRRARPAQDGIFRRAAIDGPTGGQPGPSQPPQSGDPSLRGIDAEFRPTPWLNGRRVLAYERGMSTACVVQSADRYCRAIGWTHSAHHLTRTEGGRPVLVDVFCVR